MSPHLKISLFGTFDTAALKPGVSVTNWSGVETAFDATPTLDLGYNTTPLGRTYLRFWQTGNELMESVQFHFDMGISSFGAYFTGAQDNFPGVFSVDFLDSTNTMQSLVLDKPAPNPNDGTAATQFLGFVDPTAAITDVWVVMRRDTIGGDRDLIGIDDVRYTACVPEPASMAAIGLGVATLIRRRRRA